MSLIRKVYPSDVSDHESALVAPYLTLVREDAGQRDEHPLREVFNGPRYVVKTGAPWRWMPNDLPPWVAVYQHPVPAAPWIALELGEIISRVDRLGLDEADVELIAITQMGAA